MQVHALRDDVLHATENSHGKLPGSRAQGCPHACAWTRHQATRTCDSSDSGSDMAGPGLIDDDASNLDRGTTEEVDEAGREGKDS